MEINNMHIEDNNCILEYLDLVDENDNIIGRDDRNKITSSEIKNYRVINILIFNSKGKLIIPKRSANRRLFPNCYDFSVGGHVESGESYEKAAYRELKEELGIENVELQEIGYFHPEDIGTSSFSKLYKLVYDGKLDFDTSGISEIQYFSLKSVYKLLKENPNKFKGDFKPIFYWYLDKYVNKQERFFCDFPDLETDRFNLKELTEDYISDLVQVMSDNKTMEYSGMIIINPEKQARMFLKKIREMYENKKGIRWTIIDKVTGKYVGDIGFYNIDLYSKHVEMGYTISKKYWRQGVASECINKLTQFAFTEFNMNKIILMIDDRNKKSINLANKLRFNHDGILREEYYLKDTNEYISMNIFSKLKSEY